MTEQLDQLRVEFVCVKCGQRNRVPVRWLGRWVRCGQCQTANRVGRQEDGAGEPESGAGEQGLRLPVRVSHARYLETVEQKLAGHAEAELREERKRGWGWGVWWLIVVNGVVAAGAVGLIVMKIVGG